MLAKTSTHTYFRTREVLFFSCTVFYSIQIVLCLSSASEDDFLGYCQAEEHLSLQFQVEQYANRSLSGERGHT